MVSPSVIRDSRSVVVLRDEWVLLAMMAGLVAVTPSTGADFGSYLDWGRAAVSGDIFRLSGEVLSPMGVPHSQWSSGTGLLFALGKLVVDPLAGPRHDGYGAHVVAGLAAFVFWWAMLRLLHRAARGDALLALFGAAITFVGTHAGYYSLAHGSETFADLFVALLALWVVEVGDWRAVDCVVAGSTVALLLTIRPHLVIYGLAALAGIALRISGSGRRDVARSRIEAVVFIALPLTLGAAQVALVNRWMTGSALHSPYVFGTGSFRSVNLAHPEILAVLVHPWHGLLTYHPLYALGALALLWAMVHAGGSLMRLGSGVVFTLLLLHLYAQASYYVWWLGSDTFGSRGMSVASVLLVPMLIRTLADEPQDARRRTWSVLMLACSLWSYPLLYSGYSPLYAGTQFFSYRELLVGQGQQLRGLLQPTSLLFHGLGLALAWGVLRPAATPTTASTRLLLFGTRLLGGLVVGYLLLRAAARPWPILVTALALLAAGGGVGISVRARSSLASPLTVPIAWARSRGRQIERLVGWATCLVLIATTLLFVNLAIQTERRIRVSAPPPRPFTYRSSAALVDAQQSYGEYQRVPGFIGKKASLREFLEHAGLNP